MAMFHYSVKADYVLQKVCHEDCATSVCIFYMKFNSVFAEGFLHMQTKLELFSPEIVPTLENKELLSHFRIHRENSASAQMDGRTVILWSIN